MTKCFYLGCLGGETGHYFVDGETKNYNFVPEEYGGPWQWQELDSKLAPPKNGQFQFEADMHWLKGWSAFSYWDRSVDDRFGSNSTFVFDANLSFHKALEIAKRRFPSVFARIAPSDITLHRNVFDSSKDPSAICND